MMKKTKRIYRLKDISIESVVDAHIRRLKEPTYIGERMMMIGLTYDECLPSKYADTNVNRKVFADKFTYLIHLIIVRCHNSEYGWAYLSSTILQKVIGRDYSQLIKTLLHENLIWCTYFYVMGKLSYGYRLCDGVESSCTMEYDTYLNSYEHKLQSALADVKKRQRKESQINLNNDKLFERYESALSLLRLPYREEANRFLQVHPFVNETSKNYYASIIERYHDITDRGITSIDKNKRIYSILTSTPRLIKPFLNLSFACDIHNSHPLLFCKVLCDYYSVPKSLIDGLYSLLDNSRSDLYDIVFHQSHNVMRFLHKALNINKDKEAEFANIPKDVWEYIIVVSLGVFWDVIIPKDSHTDYALLRSDVKVLLFSEVFYSKTMTTRCKYFAKLFRKRFPNVYKVVEAQKKGLKRDERTVLSNRMMALESELFHEILTLLYYKRFRVLSIHDAIVVLDTPSNKDCTPELVQSIIQKVYRKNGLYPNVSTDYYGQDYLQQFMQDEEQLSAKAAEYRSALEQAATNGNEIAQQTLIDLNNGYRTICYDDENNVIAHLVNPKDLKSQRKS